MLQDVQTTYGIFFFSFFYSLQQSTTKWLNTQTHQEPHHITLD